MKRVVLDASALMVFFANRPGANRLRQLLIQAGEGKAQLSVSVVNWGEVYYTRWRTKGPQVAEETLAEMDRLRIEVVSTDRELTRLAARLRAQYKVPYADCFAAALAQQRKATLATADTDFAPLQKQVKILWTTES